MRVALVHYWLVNMRGGEKVLEALCELFPEADIFTHVYDPFAVSSVIRRHKVTTTFIQRLPFAKKWYQRYLPLMPLALEQLDLRGYDLVISMESGPAKGVITDANTPHICYCHTPMRYLWDFYQYYLESSGLVTRTAMRFFSHSLRQWDCLSANRVDTFIANSDNVARRIRKHYRRDSHVVYPPVDVASFAPDGSEKPVPYEYYLFFGQLIPYKRLDLAIDACTRLGRHLIVIGEGSEKKTSMEYAGPTVHFLGRQDTTSLKAYLQHSRALLFPGEEDFGIIPLEVAAAGRPVIAYKAGGALETVVPGKTGLFFEEPTASSLVEAILQFEEMEGTFMASEIVQHAQRFAPEAFSASFKQIVSETLQTFNKKDIFKCI